MDRRRGNPTLWLLAAGAFALVGCRTGTGSEESSSWFNFSSRRGGQGGGSAGTTNPAVKPRTVAVDRPVEKPTTTQPEPPKNVAPAPPAAADKKPAAKTVPAKTGTTKPAAGAQADALRLPKGIAAKADPSQRPPGSSLGLPSPPAGKATARPAAPLALDLPEGAHPKPPASKTLPIASGKDAGSPRPVTASPLPIPAATIGRRPPNASLRLPGFGETETPTAARHRLRLPEVDSPTASRETRSALPLPSGDASEKRGATAPSLPVPTLDGASRERTGESLGLPSVAERAPTTATHAGRSLGVDGILPAAAPGKTRANALTLPSPDAGPALGAEADARIPLPTGLAAGGERAPNEALRIDVDAGAAASSSAGAGPRWPTGKAAERTMRPPAEARAVPAVAPATGQAKSAGERPLRAPSPEAQPALATVPLPFRLGDWLSDENQHRRWREEQQERAGTEEKARQAEQERLRQALLRFLLPADPAK